MTDSLDVLLIETERGSGLLTANTLGASGHRVHRCFPGENSPDAASEVCVAVTEGDCPIDAHGIDVAVVAGPLRTDQPAQTAAGVTCALRRQVPLVADDSCTASFGSRLTGRANGDISGACQRAAETTFAGLRASILARLTPTFVAHRLDPADMGCRIETDGPRLRVTVTGPPAAPSLRQALGVRVLDAIHADDRVYGQVDVSYEATS